ncbi:MAG: aminotransferase class V-fold PLP-dependent enzyme, partial [Nannocystaceae bacterium]
VGFPGCEGQLLLINLDLEGIMVSTGAACSSGTVEASPVLLALGCGDEAAREVLRISIGKDNREDEIDALIAALPRAIARVRGEAA